MSTNFYIKHDASITGFNGREHIGKRSSGWAFTFQGRNHKTRYAWERRLNAMGAGECIVDEYGRELTCDEFIQAVNYTLNPRADGSNPRLKDGDIILSTGERDRSRNWVDGGCSFSIYDFS